MLSFSSEDIKEKMRLRSELGLGGAGQGQPFRAREMRLRFIILWESEGRFFFFFCPFIGVHLLSPTCITCMQMNSYVDYPNQSPQIFSTFIKYCQILLCLFHRRRIVKLMACSLVSQNVHLFRGIF